MPAQSILFTPNIDEQDLDRETDKVDERLAGVGEDVPVSFDPEEMDMGGLTPAGAPGGGVGPGAAAGAGRAAGAAGLASKIPKPVAGVTAAAALPVALAGGVGIGMLSAMQDASARLQTSSTILGQAFDTIWRPLGDRLDELFIRDVVVGIRDEALQFEELVRDGGTGLFPASREEAGRRLQAAGQMAGMLPTAPTIVAEMGLKRVGSLIAGDFSWPSPSDLLDTFAWPTAKAFLRLFTWPTAGALASDFNWPAASALARDFDWPTPTQLLRDFDAPGPSDIVDEVFGGINLGPGDVLDAITGGGGDGGDNSGLDIDIPGTGLGGGANERTGSTSPSSGMGGDGIADKFDRLIREVQRSGETVLNLDNREIARARARSAETDPRTR